MKARSILTCLAILSWSRPAVAHAFLEHANPGAGATLKTAPSQIALVFGEKLEPVFSGVEVSDSAGRNVQAGAIVVRGNTMVAPLRPLGFGSYRVAWHAVSVDAHRTEGAYTFTVKP